MYQTPNKVSFAKTLSPRLEENVKSPIITNTSYPDEGNEIGKEFVLFF